MPAGEVFDLQANIDGELIDGVGDSGEPFVEFVQEPFGFVKCIGNQEFAHVSEVIVDCCATNTGVFGDVGHGESGESSGVEELPERFEDSAFGVFALSGVCCGRNTRHSDTLPQNVNKLRLWHKKLPKNLRYFLTSASRPD